jgi:hypothetical protein
MRVVSRFAGKNSEFRSYLAARMYPGKVVRLAEYREKRKAVSRRTARVKPVNPIIA